MTAPRLLLSAALIACATSASAFIQSFDLPYLEFPQDKDVISTQSCETDPQTGVIICGTGE